MKRKAFSLLFYFLQSSFFSPGDRKWHMYELTQILIVHNFLRKTQKLLNLCAEFGRNVKLRGYSHICTGL